MKQLLEVLRRLAMGQSHRRIAQDLDMARNTVRRYAANAQASGVLPLGDDDFGDLAELAKKVGWPVGSGRVRPSLVDPFAPVVKQLAEQAVEAKAIWQILCKDHGFSGSYQSVRRFIQRTASPSDDAVCRIETPPGEQAQVDFGYAGTVLGIDGKQRRVWAFVMTLSWSRHQYVEFVYDQKIGTWIDCHRHAFEWFGGVPRTVVIDNLKSAVLKASLHDPVVGEAYRHLARHYGFVISICRPRTPRHKGKVENGVHYVKRNFLAGRQFADLQSMNDSVREWAMETAGTRTHGTTKQQPLERFEHELGALKPLPADAWEPLTACEAKVHRDCHVVVHGAYYSVGAEHIGKKVQIHIGPRLVEIYDYDGINLLATHPVAVPGERRTRMEHYPSGKRAWMENPPERCLERASSIGPNCRQVAEALLGDKEVDRLRSAQSLLRLAEKHGAARLENACRRAVHFQTPDLRRIRAILDSGADHQALDVGAPAPAAPAANYRFCRTASEFFPKENLQ